MSKRLNAEKFIEQQGVEKVPKDTNLGQWTKIVQRAC
jgi:hypothetical protein